jgi:hypothetical protein
MKIKRPTPVLSITALANVGFNKSFLTLDSMFKNMKFVAGTI